MTADLNGPDGPVTYEDLVGLAAGRMVAAVQVTTVGFGSVGQARREVAGWRSAVIACQQHARILVGPLLPGRWLAQPSDPREAAAADLVDALEPATPRMDAEGGGGPLLLDGYDAAHAAGVASAWAGAARALGAATDLLGTHRRGDGSPAAPDSPFLGRLDVREHGYRILGELSTTVLGCGGLLATQAVSAGVPWAEVAVSMPELECAARAAVMLRASCRDAHTAGTDTSLARSTVARPPVRVGQPWPELAGRVARVHRFAWTLTERPWVGTATLADVTGIATDLHTATRAVLLQAAGESPAAAASLRTQAHRVAAAGQAWTQAAALLTQTRSPEPRTPGVHGDAVAIRDLLRVVTAGTDPPEMVAGRLLPLAAAQADVARWVQASLGRAAVQGQVYVPGRTLTGEQIDKSPDLISAKLTNRLVVAPAWMLTDLREALNVAGRVARTDNTPASNTLRALATRAATVARA